MTVEAVGLTSEEARARLRAAGRNEPVVHTRLSALRQYLRLYANPLILALLGASAVSVALGQHTDAVIIVAMVLVVVVVAAVVEMAKMNGSLLLSWVVWLKLV